MTNLYWPRLNRRGIFMERTTHVHTGILLRQRLENLAGWYRTQGAGNLFALFGTDLRHPEQHCTGLADNAKPMGDTGRNNVMKHLYWPRLMPGHLYIGHERHGYGYGDGKYYGDNHSNGNGNGYGLGYGDGGGYGSGYSHGYFDGDGNGDGDGRIVTYNGR